jgi:hypothetical protein
MDNEMTMFEINGVKLQADLRQAKRVDTLVVGSKVKLLTKGPYSGNAVFNGVVVGFEQFQTLPTIIVCYLKIDFTECKLEFAYINSASAEKYELIASVDDELPIEKADILSRMDREIEKKRDEIADIERKREYFLRNFNRYFETA